MGKLRSFGTFAIPDYPAQTDMDFKEDDWVVGDPEKGYEWDSSKDGDANISDMNKAVETDRQSMVENRLTKDRVSDWEGRAKISRRVRKNLFKKFGKKETTESKTIKVGEDAVGKLTSEIHYALVVDNKVIKTGTKDDMLKLHDETKGSRVWVTSSKEGAIVEEAPMNSTGPSISMPPTMKKKKKKSEDFLKRWESYGNKHDNGVHEQGTDETRKAYQEDTPGQEIDEYIEVQTKFFQEQKNKVQTYFSQIFGNPLEGYPANEEIEVK